jgi:hypothetical protein
MGWDGEHVTRNMAEEEMRDSPHARTPEQTAQHREWAHTKDLRALAGCRCWSCSAYSAVTKGTR